MTSRVVPRKNLFSSLDEMEGDFCLYKEDFEMSDKVIIFDTTLRDGEQAPGCSMNLKEKLAVAHQDGVWMLLKQAFQLRPLVILKQ